MMMKNITLSNVTDEAGLFIDGDWIESKDQDPNGEVRLIQLADIGDGIFLNKSHRFLTKKKALELKCTFLQKGDLLIARMPAPLGRTCIFPGDERECVTVVDIGILRPNSKEISNEYLKYLVNSSDFRNKIISYTTGTTRKRISRSNLDKIHFNLPVYEDQIRIAAVLIQAEKLIVKRKESIKVLDELLKSTFLEMFGDLQKNKSTNVVKTIEEICKFKGGGTPSKAKPEYFTGNIPWVSPKDMKSLYVCSSIDKITQEAIINSSTSLIPKGSVLMVVRSGILKNKLPVAINTVDVTINQDIKAFTSKVVIASYLLYFFISNEKIMLKKVRATTADNFNFDDIKKMKIMIPSLPLQHQFAAIVEKAEVLKAKYTQNLTELENLYSSLSQRAFKGELDLSKVPLEK
ncbi:MULTISPECIES: restriction endonuclease subunit S [Pelosinus]|uniref:Restriction modification system DNA specificity domain-containing protein n=1 Tax=Pelosinus fermentans B4 TaxID=1149862 RepID=I8RIB1_9FIRM|nr:MULTISPECIES: restriction endonuclease subunit S [Pelosinus]EIW17755.1 restriction modification system DNA specificity domain-containing protein [Pelosinus fermentans B4]EIW23717.1 restriction modification system DNA specificity domain-containing protein [Pelosinus fermentans A11]OAM94641.1 restriction modification system DNA specificity domain-containing protein [Pelosinus fermentans DSM 17108]SDR14305.1 type I restriction enzyme, S subunit [Pelosinus fermentans]